MKLSDRGRAKRSCYHDHNLQIIFIITVIATMGTTSIAPAFPEIIRELHILPQDVGLLIAAFTLPSALLTLPIGVLADGFGRKRILVPSLLLFGVAGVACALVRDFNLLLLLRFFEGAGAASLFPLSVMIIGDLYSGEECTAAMGYNVGFINVGHASFPAIGGALAMLGWQYPFVLPIIAVPVGIVVLISLKNPEPSGLPSLREYLGNAWRCLKNRHIDGLLTAGAVAFLLLRGPYLTFFPILFGLSFGLSPLVIGIIMALRAIVSGLSASLASRLHVVYSSRGLIKAACVLYAISLAAIPFISNVWLLLVPTIIFGIAHGINEPSLHILLNSSVTAKHRNVLMSLNWTFLPVGGAIGPIIMGIFYGLWGIGSVYFAGAAFAIFMLALVSLTVSRRKTPESSARVPSFE